MRPPTDAVPAKIRLHTPLEPADLAVLSELALRPRAFAAQELVAAAGDPLDLATIVLEGMVCRTKLLPDGRRQILALLLPGDMVDLHASVLGRRDDNLEAVSPCRVALVPQSRVLACAAARPALHEAFMREAMIEAAIAREWVLNLGRRSALEALAHLLCELKVRMDGVELGDGSRYPLPLRQQHLADCLGLSLIHLNRTLSKLKASGCAIIRAGEMRIDDWNGLVSLAHFGADYLHFRSSLAA